MSFFSMGQLPIYGSVAREPSVGFPFSDVKASGAIRGRARATSSAPLRHIAISPASQVSRRCKGPKRNHKQFILGIPVTLVVGNQLLFLLVFET